MSISLVVLAAGMGSRYGGSKQLDGVGPNGETILHYSLYDAVREGFEKIVFVVRPDEEKQIRERLGRELAKDVVVEYALQEIPEGRKKPWGTGHAVLVCKDVVHEPFGVVNCDDLYGRESFKLLSGFLKSLPTDSSTHCMVSFCLRKTLSPHGHVARGICEIEDGFLVGITECVGLERDGEGARMRSAERTERRFSGDERVSMNMWGFSPTLFPVCERAFKAFVSECESAEASEFYMPSVVDGMIGDGVARVRVLDASTSWLGVTYREDRDAVASEILAKIQQGEYPERIVF